MTDLDDRIRALLANKGLMRGADLASQAREQTRDQAGDQARTRASGGFEIQHVIPGELHGDTDNGFYLVRTDYPLDARHGSVSLGDALDAAPEHIAFAACDPDLEEFNPATALFLDTETTGLSGGTGTVAFLIGAGWFEDDVFRLEQCFMRDFDDEEPMLEYLDKRFQRAESVVTYNGKSFDIPLLRTRFIQNRRRFRLDAIPHFDLVHAARRFWKLRLQNCALNQIEPSVMGVQRHDDIPSSEIPRMWFDYLRSRDARPLDRVFYHHRMDILSLVALTACLSLHLASPDGSGFTHAEDKLSLIRLHFRSRRYADVITQGWHLLETEPSHSLRTLCLELIALAAKRSRDWDTMETAWKQLAGRQPVHTGACHELAKLYEHRLRDLPEALRVCEMAIQALQASGDPDGLDAGPIRAFQRRISRIQAKLARGSSIDSL